MVAVVLRVLLAVVIVGAITAAHVRLPEDPIRPEGAALVPDPDLAKLASFGFDGIVATAYWLRAIQMIGAEGVLNFRADEMARTLDVVTSLDPRVSHPYRFAAIWLNEDEAAVREANRLLKRGIEHHPDDWRQYFYLAFNHFFYLGEFDEAADALEPALGLPDAPPYLGRLLPRLRSQGGDLEAASLFLQRMADQAPDGYVRAGHLRALDEIETERRARHLDRAREIFKKWHGRDIDRVEELASLEPKVLSQLPPEPHGWEWVLDERGRIVSSYVGYRYEVKLDARNRALISAFRERSVPADKEAARP